MEKRIITTDVTEEDFSLEGSLRPQTLEDYVGQEKTKSTLKIYIEAEKRRCLRPCAVLRTSGTWKDDAFRDYRK